MFGIIKEYWKWKKKKTVYVVGKWIRIFYLLILTILLKFIIKLKINANKIILCNFLIFLEYFEKTYLINYKINEWNYYNCIEHITNNAMESFNNYLKYLVPSKSNFYKFVNIIRKEENVSYLEYNNIEEGNWNKKK